MPRLFVRAFVFGKEPSNTRQYLPKFSRQINAESPRLQLRPKAVVLPCGYYTSGETAFKFLHAYHMASFLDSVFSEG
jgi:hypothetical protein